MRHYKPATEGKRESVKPMAKETGKKKKKARGNENLSQPVPTCNIRLFLNLIL